MCIRDRLIVADGTTVWVHDPDLQQVSKRPQGVEEANSPLAILLDPSRLDREFTVQDAGTVAGVEWLRLTPKQATAPVKSARLGFGKAGLVQMEYIDALGQRTTISFSGWKRNPTFAKGTFVYRPGKGVDVIGGGKQTPARPTRGGRRTRAGVPRWRPGAPSMNGPLTVVPRSMPRSRPRCTA